jgi:hypothetical protein
LAHLLFNRALYFVDLACDLILCAWLHFVAFFEFRPGLAPWAYASTIIKKTSMDICSHRDTRLTISVEAAYGGYPARTP